MSVDVLRKVVPRAPGLAHFAATPLAWALLATAFMVVATLAGPGPSLTDWLGDTDDAVRLVTVRELIAGAPWFDTTLPRIGAPEPLVSHWSRLIDLPLALSIAALSPVLGAERAELITRIVWPTVLFLALALLVAREAQRRAGPWAAAFVLVLVVTSAMALTQFRPGRVDHHNAQILCAVAGLLLLARSWSEARIGWVAGLLLGLGLAIGYEAIALVVPTFGLATLLAVWQPSRGKGVLHAAVAATGTLLLALLLTTAPVRWLDVRCDALSLNLPVLALFCTAGLWAALALSARPILRVGLLGAAAAIGVALYAAMEPACLAGPFGQVNPALKPIWLDQVVEGKSVLWLLGKEPAQALAFLVFVIAGSAAQVVLWRRERSVEAGFAAGCAVLAAALGCWQIKLMPYACWMLALPLAVWAGGLHGILSISTPLTRIAVAVVLSQATLDAGFHALLSPWRASHAAAASLEASDPRRPCSQSPSVRPLAVLPPGLIAADIDLGPFIVALSPHRVVAAPYHRLEQGILANHAILDAAPDTALRTLKALGVTYIAVCAERTAVKAATSLRDRLLANETIGFLQPLDIGPGAAIRVWRVIP